MCALIAYMIGRASASNSLEKWAARYALTWPSSAHKHACHMRPRVFIALREPFATSPPYRAPRAPHDLPFLERFQHPSCKVREDLAFADVRDADGAFRKLKVGLHRYFTELAGAHIFPKAKTNLVADTVMNQTRRWGHGYQFSLVEFVLHAFLFGERVLLLDGHQSSGHHGDVSGIGNTRHVPNIRHVHLTRKRLRSLLLERG